MIPVQFDGRVSSFENFSVKTLRLITGKGRWQGVDAYRVMLDLLSNRSQTLDREWIRLDSKDLKTRLGLPPDARYFSYQTLLGAFENIENIALLDPNALPPNHPDRPLLSPARLLYARMNTVSGIYTGAGIAVFPPSQGQAWNTLAETENRRFEVFEALLNKYHSGDLGAFRKGAALWTQSILAWTPDVSPARLSAEVTYYELKPFLQAFAAYLIWCVLALLFGRRRLVFRLGLMILIWGLLLHTTGLVLRGWILGRPPVSNMYESIIFAAWAAMVFGLIFAVIRRSPMILTLASALTCGVMVYANLLPISDSLDVLAPVLKSNTWLALHVLTVTASYGAFVLAAGLAHRHLILEFLKRPDAVVESSGELILKVLELGIILLGAGIVTGGIWANASWGRFWGWDPKETWSLITFVGYLTLVHMSLFRRIRSFGLAVGSIAGFLLVVMTWYGVNFLIGQGLHSYGSVAGGLEWVGLYAGAEALVLLAAGLLKIVRR
ncbi:MAG: cytochrome c biogenesis protein CcsA, partial [Candidatus Omnitrophica bacterium]|nr:cytochrome c biogenesis protein CcsA [Candidatus Omnitrophota bacterium]